MNEERNELNSPSGSQSCRCNRCGWTGHLFDTMHTENRVTAFYCPNCPQHKDDENSLSVQIIHKTEDTKIAHSERMEAQREGRLMPTARVNFKG